MDLLPRIMRPDTNETVRKQVKALLGPDGTSIDATLRRFRNATDTKCGVETAFHP